MKKQEQFQKRVWFRVFSVLPMVPLLPPMWHVVSPAYSKFAFLFLCFHAHEKVKLKMQILSMQGKRHATLKNIKESQAKARNTAANHACPARQEHDQISFSQGRGTCRAGVAET